MAERVTTRVAFRHRYSGVPDRLDFACAQDGSAFFDWLRNSAVGIDLSIKEVPRRSHNQGVRNPNSKLGPADVRVIRRSVERGDSRRQVAARHGVSLGCVDNVVRRRTWSHVV